MPHNISSKDRVHPTQMPLALVERILQVASKEGDTVLDNFMGSGTTGLACKQKLLSFIGIEINPDNYAIAEKRINYAFI